MRPVSVTHQRPILPPVYTSHNHRPRTANYCHRSTPNPLDSLPNTFHLSPLDSCPHKAAFRASQRALYNSSNRIACNKVFRLAVMKVHVLLCLQCLQHTHPTSLHPRLVKLLYLFPHSQPVDQDSGALSMHLHRACLISKLSNRE